MAPQTIRQQVRIASFTIFILVVFVITGEVPQTVMADETIRFDCTFLEGMHYRYEITEFETASGKIEAPVALGGGPQIFANSTPSSFGGHFLPVGRVENPNWSNLGGRIKSGGHTRAALGDWRNVIMLGKGYELDVMIDTISPEEEVTYPEDEFIYPLITTYNHYGAGPKTNYLPVNPYSETTVFLAAKLATLVWDDEANPVTLTATDSTTGEVGEWASFLDFKLTEPLILPITQYGNATFYQVGDQRGERSCWIGVSMHVGLGYWTLSYRANIAAETPLGVIPSYEVGLIGHNISTGIAESFEIVNRAMLAWMTDPRDPLVAFKLERIHYPRWEGLQTFWETRTEKQEIPAIISALSFPIVFLWLIRRRKRK